MRAKFPEKQESESIASIAGKAVLSEFEKKELYNKMLMAAAALGMEVSEVEEPAFVESSSSEKNTVECDNLNARQVKITKDDSSFSFVVSIGSGISVRSDHWTKESIDAAVRLFSKSGCYSVRMYPLGSRGALPAHLRAYAIQAFKKHGMVLTDPTPPTAEQIKVSEERYQLRSKQKSIKDNLMSICPKENSELSKTTTSRPTNKPS